MKGLETILCCPYIDLLSLVIIIKILAVDIACCMHIHVSIIASVVVEVNQDEGHGIVAGVSSC